MLVNAIPWVLLAAAVVLVLLPTHLDPAIRLVRYNERKAGRALEGGRDPVPWWLGFWMILTVKKADQAPKIEHPCPHTGGECREPKDCSPDCCMGGCMPLRRVPEDMQ